MDFEKAQQAFSKSIFLLILLSACAGTGRQGREGQEQFFLPPTMVPTSSPTSAGSFSAGEAAATPQCTDGLSFLEDLTLPDGTEVSAGASLDKRWRVRNSGTCHWDERYRLRLVAGPELGAAPETALFPALSDTEAIIRMVFRAPDQPGQYRSAWQAYNPSREPFGDTIFLDIVVK